MLFAALREEPGAAGGSTGEPDGRMLQRIEQTHHYPWWPPWAAGPSLARNNTEFFPFR